jgi:hypothetical protein
MKRLVFFLLFVPLSVMLSVTSSSQTNIPKNAIPSSKHYRESGVGNATGRAGAASMTARALLGKDGNTLVEVTTGILDSSATSPGSFSKVQFKPFTLTGDALFTQNFTANSTSGYYSFNWPSLHRAEQVQLQGNIAGIDQNRADVVTVVETVKLRPDLTVRNLTFPSSAIVNHAVNIGANLVEMNGDASATTTCVLTIDGTHVDQINNVYVDAAGSVSCAFTYVFPSSGSHSIQVTSSNVVPADYDTANNAASGTITITNPGNLPHGSGSFSSEVGGFPVHGTYSFEEWYLGNIIENDVETYGTVGIRQGSSAYFYNNGCGTQYPAFQFPVSVSYTETMDATSVYSLTTPGITGYSNSYPSGGWEVLCNTAVAWVAVQYGSDNTQDHGSYVQSFQYFDSAGNEIYSDQEITGSRAAGDVTYFSDGYQCYWWNDPTFACQNPPMNYYTWNSTGTNVYGTIVPVGTRWGATVVVQDSANYTVSGSIDAPLTTTQYNYSQPNTCTDYSSGGYTYHFCSGADYTYTSTVGFATK